MTYVDGRSKTKPRLDPIGPARAAVPVDRFPVGRSPQVHFTAPQESHLPMSSTVVVVMGNEVGTVSRGRRLPITIAIRG